MDLQRTRLAIDRIDREMVGLMCERMRLAAEIAAYKRENGLPVGDPAREREILKRAAAQAGPELARYIEAFYAAVFEISKGYQTELIAAAPPLSGPEKGACTD